MLRRADFFAEEKKTDIFILNVMVKNLHFYFGINT